jgi:hypothetical protein
MSARTDFTDAEWTELLRAPALAGILVVTASPSGPIGVFKELSTMGRWILDAGKKAAPGSLVAALVEDIRAIAERKRPAPEEERVPAAEFRAHALERLRRATAILPARATPAEGEEWKQWILDVCANIARAAKEGTVFGFGGTQVSDAERTALRDIADALGTTAPAL